MLVKQDVLANVVHSLDVGQDRFFHLSFTISMVEDSIFVVFENITLRKIHKHAITLLHDSRHMLRTF